MAVGISDMWVKKKNKMENIGKPGDSKGKMKISESTDDTKKANNSNVMIVAKCFLTNTH